MSETLPKPNGKVVNFDQITSLAQATDYALAGYHAAIAKQQSKQGAPSRLWKDASDAYAAAYGTILGLHGLPAAEAVKKATETLHQANHLSDVASSA